MTADKHPKHRERMDAQDMLKQASSRYAEAASRNAPDIAAYRLEVEKAQVAYDRISREIGDA